MTVLSEDADATSLPSGEKATAQTTCEWPSSVRRTALVAEFQNLTVLSQDADTASPPSVCSGSSYLPCFGTTDKSSFAYAAAIAAAYPCHCLFLCESA